MLRYTVFVARIFSVASDNAPSNCGRPSVRKHRSQFSVFVNESDYVAALAFRTMMLFWWHGLPQIRCERTTEGFYDTASRRSQQASQHQAVYQKKPTLPKRRCPRRDKSKCLTEAIKRGKPNDAPTAKPRPCVKTMLCGKCVTSLVCHTILFQQGFSRDCPSIRMILRHNGNGNPCLK